MNTKLRLTPVFTAAATIGILSFISASSVHAATVVSALTIANSWGFPPNDQGVTSKTYTTDIDGISTIITFSTNGGNLWAGDQDGGLIGINAGDLPAIESRGSEVLTISLAPATATGIQYTITQGAMTGAGANANSPTFAFTDVAGTTTYASDSIAAREESGLLNFTSAPSAVDSISFTLRQTATTADTTEGGFFAGFTATAIPEPSATALLGLLGGFMLVRRRVCR